MVISLLAAACVPDPIGAGSFEDLTVVAIRTDPPKPVLGADVTVRIWVANPDDHPIDVLLWSCVRLDDRTCAETSLGLAPSDRMRIVAVSGTSAATTLTIPTTALPPEGTPRVTLWALACAVGSCAVLEALRDPEIDPDQAAVWLDDFESWPDTPGFEVAHLAFRQIEILEHRDRYDNHHPIVTMPRGGSGTLRIVDPDGDDWSVWTGATDDHPILRPLGDDAYAVDWIGVGQVFVVVTDDDDGVGVWSTQTP